MKDFNNIDDAEYWGLRPTDPQWYNRKQVLTFGKGHPYPSKGKKWRPKLKVCFFSLLWRGEHYVFDEHGNQYDDIPSCCQAIRKQYDVKPKRKSAVSVVFHETPLGKIPAKSTTQNPRPRRRRRTT